MTIFPNGFLGSSRRRPRAPSLIAPVTPGEAYRSYIDDPTHAWSANTWEAYETSRKLAIAVIGETASQPPSVGARFRPRFVLVEIKFKIDIFPTRNHVRLGGEVAQQEIGLPVEHRRWFRLRWRHLVSRCG